MVQNVIASVIRTVTVVTKKILAMNLGEKILVIGLLAITILFFITPLFVINSNVIDQSLQYVFLPFQRSLVKTFVVVQGVIVVLLLYALHIPSKNFIVERLWFHGNTYVMYMIGILLAWGAFVSMGEILSMIEHHTTVMKPTMMYYILQIWFIVLFAIALYFSLSLKKHKQYRGHVVWYHGHDIHHTSKKDDGGESLFE